MANTLSRYYPILLIALLLAMHLPFINADPDTEVSVMSRGAWTDEGLNTIQVRNMVNHGYISMDECDNLIKTPYFGFVLVPFYSVFGTHIWVGRLLVLACSLIMFTFWVRDSETRFFGFTIGVLALMQFHTFHFSHYSMAEMMAISWIMLGIYSICRSAGGMNWLWAAASATCFSLAYYSKVTFAYAVVIPFMVGFIQLISDFKGIRTWKNLGVQTIVTGLFGTLFYFKWYVPNIRVFEMVNANQGQGRYDLSDPIGRFQFNLSEFIMTDGIEPFIVLVPVAFLTSLWIPLTNNKRTLFFALSAWLMLELHHGLLVNPPTRYLLPLFVSCVVLVAFFLSELRTSKLRKTVVWILLLGLGGYNLSYYSASLKRRTFQIEEVQNYLSNFDLENKTAIGVWGTTLAAETKARSIPIWNDFNVKVNPIAEYEPVLVFCEHGPTESGQADETFGIDLKLESDSVRQFDLWRYKVNLFWFSQQKKGATQ